MITKSKAGTAVRVLVAFLVLSVTCDCARADFAEAIKNYTDKKLC